MEFVFGEVNIICSDLDRSSAFYTELLGLREVEREKGCIHLKLGEQRFLLLPFAKEPKSVGPYCNQPAVSFDLYTKDCGAAYRFFKDKGVAFEKDPESEGGYFFIKDPDGNVIEVVPHS